MIKSVTLQFLKFAKHAKAYVRAMLYFIYKFTKHIYKNK